MIAGLLVPALILAALAWLVPQALARIFPEGARALVLLGLVAGLILWGLAAGFFVVLYLMEGAALSALGRDPLIWAGHFARLGLQAGLIWAPLLVLSVANLPRRWQHERW